MTVSSQNRLYIIINLVIFIDTLLYGIIVPAVPHYAKTFGITETLVGAIFFAYSAGLLLSSVPIGILCDKIGRVKVLIVGAVGLSLATMIYLMAESFYLLMVSRFLQGIASSASWTAGLALVAEIFPSSDRGRKLGLILSSAGVGTIVGPAFGGLLFKYIGYSYPFAIIAVIALAPIFFLVRKNKEELLTAEVNCADETSNTMEVLRNRNLLWGAITVGIASFGVGVTDPILPLHLSERFSLSSEGIGMVFAVLGIAYSFSQPMMGSLADKIGRKKVMILGLLLTAVVAPFITLAQTLVTEVIVVLLLGIVTGMISSPCLPLMAESLNGASGESNERTNNKYGMAFGVLNTAYSLGLVIGPVIGGVVTETMSFTYAMYLYSVLLVVVSFGVSTYVRETLMAD